MTNTLRNFLLLSLLSFPTANTADNLQAFPPADEGMVRHVLQLPKQADEAALKVELLVGRTVELDERNHYFFGGKIEADTMRGWGYTLYRVRALGPMAGTRIAVDPDAPKVARFITLAGEPYLIRYNSRLPLVVYVPAGAEVRYRVWSAGADIRPVEKG